MREPTPPTPPEGWEVSATPPPGTAWAALEPADPERPEGFRANLVLTVDETRGLSFRDWQVGTEELLPRLLHDYLLVDLEHVAVDGAPGGRRLAHHAAASGEALTMEQWFTLSEGTGITLTATVETWRYDELADQLALAATSWRPLTGAATRGGGPGAA